MYRYSSVEKNDFDFIKIYLRLVFLPLRLTVREDLLLALAAVPPPFEADFAASPP